MLYIFLSAAVASQQSRAKEIQTAIQEAQARTEQLLFQKEQWEKQLAEEAKQCKEQKECKLLLSFKNFVIICHMPPPPPPPKKKKKKKKTTQQQQKHFIVDWQID